MAVIPFDDRNGTIWMDGALVDWREAKTHVLSHGLHYGSSIFEGCRAYNGKIFKLEEHTERLFKSAEILDMQIGYTPEQINQACIDTLAASGFTDAYVRPVAWRGSEMMAISAQQTTTHVVVAVWDMGGYFSQDAVKKGVSLGWAKYRRPAPDMAPVHAKAAGLYMICTISKHECERDGFNDAMFLDYRGHVAEATGANVFFVKDGELHTPIADCFLNGITRRTVMGLAEQRGYKVNERTIMPEELNEMQECFLVGTAAEVTPVNQIGDVKYQVGQTSLELVSAYRELVHQ